MSASSQRRRRPAGALPAPSGGWPGTGARGPPGPAVLPSRPSHLARHRRLPPHRAAIVPPAVRRPFTRADPARVPPWSGAPVRAKRPFRIHAPPLPRRRSFSGARRATSRPAAMRAACPVDDRATARSRSPPSPPWPCSLRSGPRPRPASGRRHRSGQTWRAGGPRTGHDRAAPRCPIGGRSAPSPNAPAARRMRPMMYKTS